MSRAAHRTALRTMLALAAALACVGAGLAHAVPPSGPHPADERVRAEAERERGARADAGTEQGLRRRAASRRAYAGLGRAGAIELAKERHPELVLLPAWRAPLVPPGHSIVRYLNAFAARISDGTVVQSTVPLRAEGAGGEMAPVDLSLADAGAHFAPRNPIAPVRIAKALGDGVSLTDAGVRVTPLGVTGGSAPVLVEDTAFFHDAYRDGDFVVKPVDAGFSVNVQIRSEDSPERYRLRLDHADGHRVRETPDRRSVQVVDGERVVATITAPRAWDADHEVDVRWRLDGDEMVIDVPHRAHGGAYPYLLDPTVADWFDWEASPDHDIDGWEHFKDTLNDGDIAWHHGHWFLGSGIYAYLLSPMTYNHDDSAGWFLRAPGTARINRVEWNYVTQDWTDGTCITLGIHKPRPRGLDGSIPDPSFRSALLGGLFEHGQRWDSCDRFYDWYVGLCNVCAETPWTPGNAAVYGVRFAGPGQRSYFVTHVGRVYVYMYDADTPTVTAPSGGVPSGWGDWAADTPIRLAVADGGLGIRRFSLTSRDVSAYDPASWDAAVASDPWDGKAEVKQGQAPWATDADDWCARIVLCPQSFTSTGNNDEEGRPIAGRNARVGNLPEGINTLTAVAEDPAGNRQKRTYTLRVDHSDPSRVRLSGPLYERRGRGVSSPMTLHAIGSDTWSGVRRLELMVNGASVEATMPGTQVHTQGDPGTGGSMERDLGFDPSVLGQGHHTVTVVATDGVNRTKASEAITVIVDRQAPGAPANVHFAAPDEGSAQAGWDAASDPALPDGKPGAGIARYEARSRVAGGSFGDWRSYPADARLSEEDFDHPADTVVEWQVRAVDDSGNVGPAAETSGPVYGAAPQAAADGPLADLDDRHVGSQQLDVTIRADDDPGDDGGDSGLERLTVRREDGSEVAGRVVPCQPRVKPDGRPDKALCPMTASGTVTVDAATLPQGKVPLDVGAVDRAGNFSGSELDDAVRLTVDHTAPDAPTQPTFTEYDDASDEASLDWLEGRDPDVAQDVPGEVVGSDYRYRRAGGGFTAWQRTEIPRATVTGVQPGEAVDVELRAVDAAGNVSATTAATLVVPDQGQGSPPPALARSEEPLIDLPGLIPPGTGDVGAAAVSCVPNIKTAVSRELDPDVRNFRETRNRLGAVLDVYCYGDVDSIQSIRLTARWAIEDDDEDDGYRGIRGHYGDNRDREQFEHVIDDVREYSNIVPGLRRFCDINQGGRHRYIVVGEIDIRVSFGFDPPERSYNTDRDRPVSLWCPGQGERFERQKQAFTALSRYDVITRQRGDSPSRMLRRRLGDPPYKPEGVSRGWEAHHTVPRGRAPIGTFGRVQALMFRCLVHPNESRNGVYLRGWGLRKRLTSGRANPAYERLQAYDRENGTRLAQRYYHGSTFNRGYYDELTSRFGADLTAEAYPHGCPDGTYSHVRTVLDNANADLRAGSFGGEESGN
ncbi:MAG TPA: hypothetical protein VGW75_09185 [Solirubrobacteraceae bacterium]|nr:hypothetical protein [Solirubrobacteraceae bacterium]